MLNVDIKNQTLISGIKKTIHRHIIIHQDRVLNQDYKTKV